MASRVQLCNLALVRLGAPTITSLSDNTQTAKACNVLLDDIIERTIIEGPWATTIRRASLNKTTNTPVYEYTNEFQLPTNPKCLKVWSINEEQPGTYDYVIEGDKLYTDLATVKIKYSAAIENTQSFGPALSRAVTSHLAAELAYTLSGNASAEARMREQYMIDVKDGLAIDGQQGSSQDIITTNMKDDVFTKYIRTTDDD